jgi:REP element-mobilizing transposase RayT
LHCNSDDAKSAHRRERRRGTIGAGARELRVEFADALYHLTTRANDRRPIFRDEQDRACFLAVLAEVVSRFGWICHADCLMDNHYHLLLETPRPNLARGRRQRNGRYARRCNRRHARSGHLFGRRYRSCLVEKESHLLALSRDVVLNPVRAGICRSCEEWPWSSDRASVGLAEPQPFLSPEWLLSQFGSAREQACERHRALVREGVGERAWEALIGGISLGEQRFLRRGAGSEHEAVEIPRTQRQPIACALEALLRDEAAGAVARVPGGIQRARSRPCSGATTRPSAGGCGRRSSASTRDRRLELRVAAQDALRVASSESPRMSGSFLLGDDRERPCVTILHLHVARLDLNTRAAFTWLGALPLVAAFGRRIAGEQAGSRSRRLNSLVERPRRLLADVVRAGAPPPSEGLIWALGLGSFGLAWSISTVAVYLPSVLQRFTDADSLIGLTLAAEGLFALTLPLVVGPLSDATRSPLGRRRPYLVAALPPLALSLAFLGTLPSLPATAALLFLFFVAY